MASRRRQKARALLSEFSRTLGSEVLKVRIYREREAFVCERELLERDGTSFTMVLAFKDAVSARGLFVSDPYYPRVRGEVGWILGRVEESLRKHHGIPAL